MTKQTDLKSDIAEIRAAGAPGPHGRGESLEEALSPPRSLDDEVIDDNLRRGTRVGRGALRRVGPQRLRGPPGVVLTAGAGVGKTGIMCKLARARADVVVDAACRHDDPGRREIERMLALWPTSWPRLCRRTGRAGEAQAADPARRRQEFPR